MKTLLLVIGLISQHLIYACGGINQQVYSGKIEYSFDAANPFLCTAVITMDFDINEATKDDSIWVAWGDGTVSTIYALSITEDSVASAQMGSIHIYTHVYSGTHTYTSVPVEGYYYISFQNEYRINGVSNIANGDGINLPFYLSAQVSIDTLAGHYEPLSFPPLSVGFSGLSTYSQNNTQPIHGHGDSIVYSFTTPLETISNPVPEYEYPGQYCIDNGGGTSSFNMNPNTGDIVWTGPCFQGIFCYATLLSRYHNGHLLSSIMREQNVYVVAGYETGFTKIATGNGLKLFPNPANTTLSGKIDLAERTAGGFVEIISSGGRVLKKQIEITNGVFETDISQLQSGFYFVRLQSAEGELTEKFVKQ